MISDQDLVHDSRNTDLVRDLINWCHEHQLLRSISLQSALLILRNFNQIFEADLGLTQYYRHRMEVFHDIDTDTYYMGFNPTQPDREYSTYVFKLTQSQITDLLLRYS